MAERGPRGVRDRVRLPPRAGCGHDLEMSDEYGTRLRDVFAGSTKKIRYEYDFGASWWHEITCEKVCDREPGAVYPSCVAFASDSPVEYPFGGRTGGSRAIRFGRSEPSSCRNRSARAGRRGGGLVAGPYSIFAGQCVSFAGTTSSTRYDATAASIQLLRPMSMCPEPS